MTLTPEWQPPFPIHDEEIRGNFEDLAQWFRQFGLGQVAGSSGLAMQNGKVTVALGLGLTALQISLAKAWEKQHGFFVVTVHPGAENSTSVINNGPYDETGKESLSKGFVAINSGKAQSADLYWMSIGQ